VSIKAGPEQVFGVVLIVVAVLRPFLSYAQISDKFLDAVESTPVFFFVRLVECVIVPAVLLLTGIFALSFAKRVAKARIPKAWLQRTALADIILGVGLVVMAFLTAIELTIYYGMAYIDINNYGLYSSFIRGLNDVGIGMLFLFLVASAVVHFASAANAKELNTSGIVGIVAGVLSIVYGLYNLIYTLIAPILLVKQFEDLDFYRTLFFVISIIGALLLIAILVVRGVFWIGAAKKVAAYWVATTPTQGGGNYAPSNEAPPTPDPFPPL
jgi:hypothetical protein